ncbi:8-amino-7-oxononanoate synthase bioF2 [Mycobacterium tuberculosis]|nr:8-amino-7-oxononanoate synthase bioF2 [Mycobacterium tuberculosis]CFV05321.1 8-amino-7-oxononanoate synthase bioF2 [Mycobacterium tuberculosis]CKL80026.1 8-amino-7-oxononanoate synthase bioF2 [Mycobacterium tuberculosis]CKM05347.1 8-amino-7-oxononanoate synthase bioF2 [Mycobacterium tuberculosis]CKP12428.1 8-amino-7-oxononanoate synthase bioF2 [Mycobacterium tuberculosis]
MPTGLGYDFLRPVEDSGINDLKHYYFMADLADGQPLGRANLYSVCFDLATTDRKLTPAWRTTIKRWFPGFMTFRFLECGLLTMVSNPLALRSTPTWSGYCLCWTARWTSWRMTTGRIS